MRGKNVLFASLIPLLLLSMLAMSAEAQTVATMSVYPPSQDINAGEFLELRINIADADDVYGYGFILKYNPLLFNAIDAVYGGFFGDLTDPSQFTYFVDKFAGYYSIGCALLGPVPGVSGSGTLAIIRMQAKPGREGTGAMSILEPGLINSQMQPMPVNVEHGTVTVILYTPKVCLWLFKHGASRAIWTEPSWVILDPEGIVWSYIYAYGKITNTGTEGCYVKIRFTVTDSNGVPIPWYPSGWSSSLWIDAGGSVIVDKPFVGDYLGPGTFFVTGILYFSSDRFFWRDYRSVEAQLGGIGTAKDLETTRFRVIG